MSEAQVEFQNEDEQASSGLDVASLSDAVLWGTDWTVETIINQLRRGNIEINPRFQRRDAWSRGTKSRFIESIILGLPIPQVVLAENKSQRGRYIILDGKQRLLSLMQFSGLAETGNNAFALTSLDIRSDLVRKKYKNFEKDPSLSGDHAAFLSHTIRAIVIRNWPSLPFLHVVFQRLNTGSLKLSPQELRQALAPGPFTNFADDFSITSVEIQRLLGKDSPDPRMRDVELLVRYMAFQLFLSQYTGRMKDFLDDACQTLNAAWLQCSDEVSTLAEQFVLGVQALEEILGTRLARRRDSRLFNRSIFDALIYFAVRPEIRVKMLDRNEDVLRVYDELLNKDEFQEAVESDTAGIPHTGDRLRLWGEALRSVIGIHIAIPVARQNELGETRLYDS